MPEGYKARGEQVVLFKVVAWDANGPQHIPQRFEGTDVAKLMAERDAEIAALRGEVSRLKGELRGSPQPSAASPDH